jgi:hypothetical protein
LFCAKIKILLKSQIGCFFKIHVLTYMANSNFSQGNKLNFYLVIKLYSTICLFFLGDINAKKKNTRFLSFLVKKHLEVIISLSNYFQTRQNFSICGQTHLCFMLEAKATSYLQINSYIIIVSYQSNCICTPISLVPNYNFIYSKCRFKLFYTIFNFIDS